MLSDQGKSVKRVWREYTAVTLFDVRIELTVSGVGVNGLEKTEADPCVLRERTERG